MTVARASQWCVLSASVRGAAHVRTGSLNQDAVLVELQTDSQLPALLAVSDGHGSVKCFRSHIGSRLAVNVAMNVLRRFAAGFAASGLGVPEIEESAARLPGEIVRNWCVAILEHWQGNPITAEELEALEPDVRVKVRHWLDAREPFGVYGATLVSALRGPGYLICLQLGDGEILVVTRDSVKRNVQQPIAADTSQIANETSSLCQEDAENHFRWRIQFLPESAPALVLLATDGYPNSFALPEGFLQVASDLLNMLDQEGADSIAGSLPGWLDEASQLGSGDDVTVAILYAPPSSCKLPSP